MRFMLQFLYKRGAYLAAIGRAKYVLSIYRISQTLSLSILVEAYGLMEYEELRKINLEILNSNYPNFNIQENESVTERSWTNILTLGLLGNENIKDPLIFSLICGKF